MGDATLPRERFRVDRECLSSESAGDQGTPSRDASSSWTPSKCMRLRAPSPGDKDTGWVPCLPLFPWCPAQWRKRMDPELVAPGPPLPPGYAERNPRSTSRVHLRQCPPPRYVTSWPHPLGARLSGLTGAGRRENGDPDRGAGPQHEGTVRWGLNGEVASPLACPSGTLQTPRGIPAAQAADGWEGGGAGGSRWEGGSLEAGSGAGT